MEFLFRKSKFNGCPTVGHTFLVNILIRISKNQSISGAGHGPNPYRKPCWGVERDDLKNGMGEMDDPKNVVPPICCGCRYKALGMGRRGGDGWVTTPPWIL